MNTRENSSGMTKADLCDWIVSQGCEIETLAEYKANVIYFVNPQNGNEAWLDLPFNEKPLKAFTVCKICSDLQINIPTFAAYMKPLHDRIKKENK
jgi:hypothetical protein